MLKIKPLNGGDTGGYYLKSLPDGPAEYYLDGSVSGRWLGRGSASLGLEGPADPEAFRRVLAGRDPVTGETLITGRAATKDRTPGYDLTISAPKSVSLLAVLSDPAVGDQVREAHRRAVDAAMRLVDLEVATVRRGRDGVRQLPAELVAASFQHYTSRAVDPQLHTHVVVANMGRAADGRWTALHGQRLYGWAKTAGTLYQAQLRAELTERLGVVWGPVHKGRAEIDGFSRAQLEAFSTRRAEITAELERVGRTDPRAAQLAAWATRNPKVEIAEPLLVPRWRARAAEVGLTAEHVDTLTHRSPLLLPPPLEVTDDLLGPDGLTAHASSFDRRHALEAIANAHRAGLPVAQAADRADRLLADSRTVALTDPTRLGDRRYSTAELLATESEILARAGRRRHAGVALARHDALAAALAARPTLSAEQTRMIEALTVNGAGVHVVVGRAGAGKTYALDAARAAWEPSGVRVIGAALAARAAAELQAGAGIPSTTLDRLLIDAERAGPGAGLPANGVVVLDEAGMVGTRKLHRLLSLAERSHTKVVAVGDPRQLPEIDAGGAFAALAKTVPAVELSENRRQTQEWERAALAELRSGQVITAVDSYRDRGRVTLAPDAETARQRLVDDWWAARQAGTNAAMYALRRDDVEDLNRRARLHMAQAGLLRGQPLVAGGRRFAEGDEVLALRNDRRLGITNGTRATVAAVDLDGGTVTVDVATDRRVVLSAEYLDAGHLGYGYATTVHKSQGATVDRAFLLGSDALYREAGYVGLSRARERSDLYLVAATTGAWQDRVDLDPVARLAQQLNRSHAQQLATTVTIPQDDPAATLADLEAERDRLRRRLGRWPEMPGPDDSPRWYDVAQRQRLDAQQRLDTIGDLPRRQRPHAQAVAERDLTAATELEERLAGEVAAQQRVRQEWDRWIDDNGPTLDRYQQLDTVITERHHALGLAALADPLPHHVEALGPPPLTGAPRDRWAQAADAIDTYRQRWRIEGLEPLGPAPAADTEQGRQRSLAQRRIDDLHRTLQLDRYLDHGMEL